METNWPTPISVNTRLPSEKQRVLWFDGEWETGSLEEGEHDGKRWWRPDNHWDICQITPAMFWMPLPAEPEAVVGTREPHPVQIKPHPLSE